VRQAAPTATQREIGERLGISDSTVSRWRWGTMHPTPQQAAAFARAFGRSGAEGLVAAGYLTDTDLIHLVREVRELAVA